MSFGQEIKDFLSAAQAGQKIMGAVSDEQYKAVKQKYLEAQTKTIVDKNNDDVGQELDREVKRAAIRRSNAAAGASSSAVALRNAQIKAMRDQAAAGDPMLAPGGGLKSTIDGPATPTPVQQPAVGDADAAPSDTTTAPAPAIGGDDNVTPQLSRGGMVKKYAAGGAVEDDQTQDDTQDQNDDLPPAPAPAAAQAVPADAPAAVPTQEGTDEGAGDATDNSAAGDTDFSSRNRSGAPGYSQAAALDGVKAGLKYGVQSLGLDSRSAVPDPSRAHKLQAYAGGYGAAKQTDLNDVKKAIDPDGKLSESSANLAAIGAVYQYKMNKGDDAGAQRAAFSMIQHFRQASQQYAAIAAAAVQHGDIDGAVKAAMKSYANVPDGRDFQLKKDPDGNLSYTFTDAKTGKVLQQGIESPDKLAASAMGFARGQGFDSALLAAAGQPQPKAAVDPNSAPMKSADKKTALKQIDDAYDAQNPDDPKTGTAKYSPDDALAIKGSAFRIAARTENSRLVPGEVVAAATRIADPQALDKSGFTTKKADGGYQVTFPGKQPVFVPEATFATLVAQRNAKLQALKKTDAAAKTSAAKPGLAADMGKAVSGYSADLAANAPKKVFPGGTDTSQPAPAVPAAPAAPRVKPYVPVLAGGR